MSVPKLRFKKFDGEWAETSFQDLFIFKNGVNASKEQYGSGIKFINVLDIINNPNGITYDSIIGSVDITSKEIDKNLVKYGDVLFQRSSETREEVGQSNVYLGKEPVVFGGFVIRGSAQKEYDPIFMNGLLKTDSLRDQITQLSGGSTRFNIGQDSLNKVTAYLPSKLEQTKIASFLSAVDEKISLLTKKHELLSQYKQGMMQKLFSQQIRFKADDGSEFGEWETDLIRDVFTNKSKNYNPQIGKNLPCIELEHLSQNTGKILGTIESCEQQSTKNLFEKNSVLFGKLRPYLRKFAKPQFKGVCSSEIWVLTGLKISNEYLFQYIQSEHFSELTNIQSGSKMPRADWNVISEAEIEYPCIAEQTKIANFLSAIHQKIEKVAQQVEETKQWKKGLLQQMFV